MWISTYPKLFPLFLGCKRKNDVHVRMPDYRPLLIQWNTVSALTNWCIQEYSLLL